MRTTFLNTKDDMQWLFDVHKIPKKYKSAVLYGNEDWPEKIVVFVKKNPLHTDIGVVFKLDSEGITYEEGSQTRDPSVGRKQWSRGYYYSLTNRNGYPVAFFETKKEATDALKDGGYASPGEGKLKVIKHWGNLSSAYW